MDWINILEDSSIVPEGVVLEKIFSESAEMDTPKPPKPNQPAKELLPPWCSRSCSCYEELRLSDGLVAGCVQESESPEWREEWRRLDKMKGCPKSAQKQQEASIIGSECVDLEKKFSGSAEMDATKPTEPSKGGFIGSVAALVRAKKWIMENLHELHQAGFTDNDLFRETLPKGIIHMQVFNEPNLKIKIEMSLLTFTWKNLHGDRITQTFRPEFHKEHQRQIGC